MEEQEFNEVPNEPVSGGRRVIRIKKRRLIWSVVIIILAVLFFGGRSILHNTLSVGIGGSGADIVPSLGSSSNYSSSSRNFPGIREYNNTSDYRDTREFMKTNYSGRIQTRHVERVMDDAEDAVRDAGGRVDNLNVSEEYGSLSFVIPKSNFSDFEDDIEDISHPKLYTESTSSRNLLDQKQNIEERQETTTKTLEELQADKAYLDSVHSKKVASLSGQLSAVVDLLASVRDEMSDEEDEDILASLRKQETALVQQETSIRNQQRNENTSYNSQSNSLNNRIASSEGTLENLEVEDEDFTVNVETVDGNFSARHVSIWEMARTFLPIRPGFVILILVLAYLVYMRRTKKLPIVKFV